MVTQVAPNITDESKEVFVAYWKDACNWSGEPLVGGNVYTSRDDARRTRGNLTQLKIAGLITTFVDDDQGLSWIRFTDTGHTYAKTLGLEQDW